MKVGKWLTGITATALALLVVFGSLPMQQSTVSAAETSDTAVETSDTTAELARQLQDPYNDPFDYRSEEDKLSLQSYDLPESFDLRAVDTDGDGTADSNYVTPVKFQNPFGTCWGFAAIAAAETSILGNDDLLYDEGQLYSTGLKQGDDGNTILDLSEKHLVNFIVKPISDPDDSQYGEGLYFDSSISRLEDKFNQGGLAIYATSLFSSGIGPNLESRDLSSEGYAPDIFEYKGAKGKRIISIVDGKWADYSYDDKDDWSIPDALRFKQSYVLKESYMLPSPAKLVKDQDSDETTYEYNAAGTAAIKEQLFNKRAVQIAFTADTSMPNQEGGSQYISTEWAHYTYEPVNANHAVTVIGWDDNYPATNFISGHEPKDENGNLLNGAWLVKNSWGSGEEEFPNYGTGQWGIPVQKTDESGNPVTDENGDPVMVGSGYFWISYYDQSLTCIEALAFDKSNVDSSYYLDQYDYMPVSDINAAALPQEILSSNVFKADVNEQLMQISCQTASPGTRVQYEIYLLADNFEGPQDGICVAKGDAGKFAYGGFHKIALDTPVVVQEGQSYSIVIKQITSDGDYGVNLPMGMSEAMAAISEFPGWAKGIINKSESFMKYDGQWHDLADTEFMSSLLGEGYQYLYAIDNFPIKGYCEEIEDTVNLYAATGNAVTLQLYESASTDQIVMRYKGKAVNMPADPTITWQLKDGGADIIDFVQDENDYTRATIKAKKVGTAFVIATCEGVGSAVISITVPKENNFTSNDTGIEYGGKMSLDATDMDGKELDLSTLTYKPADPKIVTISKNGMATGKKVGKTMVTITDRRGAEATCEVEVFKAENTVKVKGGKTVTLKAKNLKKKAKTIARNKAITVSKAKGTVTYKLVSVKKAKFKKYFKVNSKTGKITVKKGLKKGTYTLKVRVKAKGNANYLALTKTVTFKVKVK